MYNKSKNWTLMDHKEFKEKLKEIGISQKHFAQMVGCGYSTVKGWETVPKWALLAFGYIEISKRLQGINFAMNAIEELKQKVQEIDGALQVKKAIKKKKTTPVSDVID